MHLRMKIAHPPVCRDCESVLNKSKSSIFNSLSDIFSVRCVSLRAIMSYSDLEAKRRSSSILLVNPWEFVYNIFKSQVFTKLASKSFLQIKLLKSNCYSELIIRLFIDLILLANIGHSLSLEA